MSRAIIVKRLGMLSFAFYAIKGCVWIMIALIVTSGLIDAPMG